MQQELENCDVTRRKNCGLESIAENLSEVNNNNKERLTEVLAKSTACKELYRQGGLKFLKIGTQAGGRVCLIWSSLKGGGGEGPVKASLKGTVVSFFVVEFRHHLQITWTQKGFFPGRATATEYSTAGSFINIKNCLGQTCSHFIWADFRGLELSM